MICKDRITKILAHTNNGTELKKSEQQLLDWALKGEISHMGQLALKKLEEKIFTSLKPMATES